MQAFTDLDQAIAVVKFMRSCGTSEAELYEVPLWPCTSAVPSYNRQALEIPE